jgi:hypothetical protein
MEPSSIAITEITTCLGRGDPQLLICFQSPFHTWDVYIPLLDIFGSKEGGQQVEF